VRNVGHLAGRGALEMTQSDLITCDSRQQKTRGMIVCKYNCHHHTTEHALNDCSADINVEHSTALHVSGGLEAAACRTPKEQC
jgi:hypothetical protein